MKRILFIVFFTVIVCNFSYADELICVKVVKICDGDTVQVMYNNEVRSIRFLGVDCYETGKINRAYKQAYLNKITIEEVVRRGKFSKQFLKDYLADADDIMLSPAGNDLYNRSLGTLYKGDVNINKLMVEKGMCMPYEYKNRK